MILIFKIKVPHDNPLESLIQRLNFKSRKATYVSCQLLISKSAILISKTQPRYCSLTSFSLHLLLTFPQQHVSKFNDRVPVQHQAQHPPSILWKSRCLSSSTSLVSQLREVKLSLVVRGCCIRHLNRAGGECVSAVLADSCC